MAIADRKWSLIQSILRNETYQQDSRLYEGLVHALHRLPVDQLANLDLLVSLKLSEAADRAVSEVLPAACRKK